MKTDSCDIITSAWWTGEGAFVIFFCWEMLEYASKKTSAWCDHWESPGSLPAFFFFFFFKFKEPSIATTETIQGAVWTINQVNDTGLLVLNLEARAGRHGLNIISQYLQAILRYIYTLYTLDISKSSQKHLINVSTGLQKQIYPFVTPPILHKIIVNSELCPYTGLKINENIFQYGQPVGSLYNFL